MFAVRLSNTTRAGYRPATYLLKKEDNSLKYPQRVTGMQQANQIFFGFRQGEGRNPVCPLPLAGLFFSLGWQQRELPGFMANESPQPGGRRALMGSHTISLLSYSGSCHKIHLTIKRAGLSGCVQIYRSILGLRQRAAGFAKPRTRSLAAWSPNGQG